MKILGTPNLFSNFVARIWVPPRAALFSIVALMLISLDSQPQSANVFVAELLSRAIYGGFLVISLIALWWPSSEKRDLKVAPSAWWWADIVLFTYTVVPILQFTVPAPRPPESPIKELLGLPLNGWPSGHQTSIFALAWVLTVARPRLAWPVWILAALMGWARMESHSHYLYQVLSGGLIGMALGWWVSTHRNGFFLPRALRLFGSHSQRKVRREE